MRFDGAVVLVAGGTGALGRAISLAFLAEGAVVTVSYRSERELAELSAAAGDASPRLDGHTVDVLDELAVKELVKGVVERLGRIDVLVNAVGGYAGGAKLWEESPDALDRMLTLNLRSGWTLVRAAVPEMLQKRRGAIVNVAATAAEDHPAGLGAYAASKAAAVALVDSLAKDLEGSGVRANSVLPHLIDTDANRKAMPGADFASWPKPEEIARVVLFLASDEARLVNGETVRV
jgi:NAD(P)-dependent dehydrogenase (short-subunit alcohol dehydrogenase family)